MRLKKVLSILVIAALMLLAACNSSSETASNGKDEKVTIEFWTMQLSPTFDDYINSTIKDFEKENPNIKVKWVDVPWGDMEKKILAAVSSKTAPDVANLNPQFASKLAELDALVDMDKMVDEKTRGEYFEGVWKSNTFDGKTFGIPWYLSSQVTMYNTKIFEEAGLDPNSPPKTFEDLAEVAKQVKEKTGKYAFFPPLDGSHLLESMVMMGVDLTNEDMTEAAFNNEKGLKAFEFYVDLYKNGYIPREVLTEGHGKAIDMYQAGQLAILASGPQFLNQVKENAPDILEVTKSSAQITGSTGKMNTAAMNLVVPKQSKHQEAAVKFSVFITNAENQVKFDKIVPILPSIESALDDPYFKELPANPTPIDEARMVSVSQLKDSEVLIPPMKGYEDLKNAMNEAVQSAMLGKQSPKDALAEAEKRWNETLSK
jgi:putative chitobiose transport system substrate-binding protein